MELLTIILASVWGKAWLAGFGIHTLYQCYRFSQMIKILDSGKSFLFCIFHILGEIAKGIVWFVTWPLFLVQLVFLKDALDDFNEKLSESVGYPLEDEKED